MAKEEQLYLAAIINANRHQKLFELGRIIKGAAGSDCQFKGAQTERGLKDLRY
jgi:hypothetical protein